MGVRAGLMIAAFATLAVCLYPPTPVLAARAWSSTPATDDWGFAADLAVTSRDESVLLWSENPSGAGSRLRAQARGGDGSPGPVESLAPERVFEPVVVAAGDGGAWAAWTDPAGVRAAYRPPGGPFEPSVQVAPGTGRPRLAANRRGDVAVLFHRYGPGFSTKRYFLAVRPAGGSWGAAEPVSRVIPDGTYWWQTDLTMTEQGDVLMSWRDTFRAMAAWRPAGGVVLPAQQLSPDTETAGVPHVAVDAAGRGVASWAESNGYGSGPVFAAVASRLGAFAGRRAIGPDADLYTGVEVEAAGDDEVVIAYTEQHWTSQSGNTMSGYLANTYALTGRPSSGEFSKPVDISRGLGYDQGVRIAVLPDGRSAVFFEDFRTAQVRVVRRPPGGSFSEPEPVLCPKPYASVARARFASDGTALVLWRRWSRAPLPAYMLSRDAESPVALPGACPPVPPGLTVTPAVAPPGAERTLDLSGATEPGERVTFSWDVGDDDTWEAEESPDPVLRWTFDKRGLARVRYRIHDRDGWMGSVATVLVTDPPRALLRAPATAYAGESVQLDATESSDPDGRIEKYFFDSDEDGRLEFSGYGGPRQSVYFTRPGTYKVAVQVEDDLGATATAETTIDVVARVLPPFGGGGWSPSPPVSITPPGSTPPRPGVQPSKASQRSVVPRLRVRTGKRLRLADITRGGLAVGLSATRSGQARVRLLAPAGRRSAVAGEAELGAATTQLRAGKARTVKVRVGAPGRALVRRARPRALILEVTMEGRIVRRTVRLR